MIARGAVGAALAACGVVSRCDEPMSRDSSPNSNLWDSSKAPASAAGTGIAKEHSTDLARAIAIMERYHAMSLDALQANADRSKVTSKSQSASLALGSEGTKFVPETSSLEQPSVPSTTQVGAVHDHKPARSRRIPASSFFTDISDGGDICVPYVIVGGGTAAWSACQALRKRNAAARILVITEERYYPYNRTPLSKELWASSSAGLFTSEKGTRNAVEYTYSDAHVLEESDVGLAESKEAGEKHAIPDIPMASIIRDATVTDLDIDKQILTLASGRKVQYEKLLLATGGYPRPATAVCEYLGREEIRDFVSVFRTVEDFRELRSKLEPEVSAVTVVGGGFLGTELAVAMATEGRSVSLICAEPGVLYNVLPRYLSEYLSRQLASIGIKVVYGAVVTNAKLKSDKVPRVVLTVGDGIRSEELPPSNKIIVATGIQPRVELAAKAGLEIDRHNGGIVVNDQMNCEASVWAAGDAASFWDRTLGRRRVEHWDHAVVTGRIAGDRMSGGNSRYGLQSMFWSDLENIGVSFTAVGLVQSELRTAASWNLGAEQYAYAPSANSYSSGIVWYIKNDVIVGAILWNLTDRKYLDAARKVIASQTRVAGDDDVKGLVSFPAGQFKAVIGTEALNTAS